MIRSMLRAAIAPAAVSLFASSALATDVSITMAYELWNANGNQSYNLFPFVNVNDFTDPSDPGNAAVVTSPNALFTADLGGAGSFGQSTIDEVITEATSGSWSLEVTDGATATTRTFSFTVNVSSALTADYFRLVEFVGLSQGDVISDTPQFDWTLDGVAFDPTAEYDSLVSLISGPAFEVGYLDPALDTSWSPAGVPLPAGATYQITTVYTNYNNAPSDFTTIDTPTPTDGGSDIDGFFGSFTLGSLALVNDLEVIPAPGTLALAGIAGLVTIRRRR